MNFLPRIDSLCCISLKLMTCIIGNTEVILGLAAVADDFFDFREEKSKHMLPIVMVGYMMDLVIVLLEIVSAILLVVGVKGGCLWLVRFWLYIHAVLFTVVLGIYLGSIVVPVSFRGFNFVHFRIYFLMYTIRSLIAYLLFIFIVNSYYFQALNDQYDIDDDIE